VIQLVRDGVRWQCQPAFAEQLDRLLADPGLVTRKSHAKLITKHELEGVTFYVKHYINSEVPGRPLKYFFKPSPARHEWEMALQIENCGVPIVRHLAYGERWSLGGLQESILITEGFDGLTLVDIPHQQSPETQAGLGKFLRLNHDRGALQRDLQRNILVHSDPLEFRRVDVYHAVVKAEVTEDERRENLALLSATVPLRDEFFAAYGWTPVQAGLTRQRADDIRRSRHYSRSDRCLKRNSEFSSERIGGLKWHARKRFLSEQVRTLLADPEQWLRTRARLFKGFERSSTVGAGDGVVLKRYNFKKPGNLLKDLFRPSRALQAYRKAHHLELMKIASPRPIAAAERRWGRILITSYLVTEEIPEARDLGAYLSSVSRPDRNVIRQIAQLIGRLHEEGFSHRDMKETNLLLDGNLKPFLIDLDGLKFLHRIPEARAAADLERLARAAAKYSCVTRLDRMQFLREYCRARRLARVPKL